MSKEQNNRPKIEHDSKDDDPVFKRICLVSDCENIVETGEIPAERDLRKLAEGIILVYDNLFNEDTIRNKAVDVVCHLARRYDIVLDMVIENARKYADAQHIDDASPYSPNSFNILARVGKGNEKVIAFLGQTVQSNWGTPRWAATEALCELDDSRADAIIIGIITGKYPPKYLDCKWDIRKIERIKGEGFVKRHRPNN